MHFSPQNYDVAIEKLMAAKNQIEPDGNCCAICGDNDHQAWECHHNPLVMAQRMHEAEGRWRCFHCNEVFTDVDKAQEHFGAPGEYRPNCADRSPLRDRLLAWANWRKACEVDNRPDINIYKKTLANTWNQIIKKLENL